MVIITLTLLLETRTRQTLSKVPLNNAREVCNAFLSVSRTQEFVGGILQTEGSITKLIMTMNRRRNELYSIVDG